MSMIRQFERIEQRTPDPIRSAVWGGLRAPYRVVRRAVIAEYFAKHTVRKLQVGCGGNILTGWLNSDLNPIRSIGVYMASREEQPAASGAVMDSHSTVRAFKDVIFVDATKRLPFPDDSFDYVFSEHMIEHIGYPDAMRLISEAHRVLKPGGKVRISTPDLRFLIDLYNQDKSETQERYLAWAINSFQPDMRFEEIPDADTFVINNFVRNWGHQFIYDEKTLGGSLERVGFGDMRRCQPGESDDMNLHDIESHGRRISDDFNRLESIVLEAVKPA